MLQRISWWWIKCSMSLWMVMFNCFFSREGESISTIYIYCSKDKSVTHSHWRVQCDQLVPWWWSVKWCDIWGSVLVSTIDRLVTLHRSFLGKVHVFELLHTNLDSIFKSRDITLPTKVHLVKAMVFPPVVMYGCESWTIKKAECWRIDAFELWCWRRLLRVPWTSRRSNQYILKEISPGCSLEGLMLKLKFPILWPPDVESWLMLKDPDAGKNWGQEEKETTEYKMVG